MATPRRNSPSLYLLLGAVALASVWFDGRSCAQMFPQWFGVERAQWPFLLEVEDKPQFLVLYPNENAQKAGLKQGDRLIPINAIPMISRSAFADLLSSSSAGRPHGQTLPAKNGGAKRSSRDPLLRRDACLLSASWLWVVSIRLKDVRAWLLLGSC
jgi:hypothetical protein